MAFRNKIYLIASAFLLAVTLNAYANPEGESVAAGNATFDRSTPNTLTVNTASNNTIINYNSFNIAGNETTRFNQPGSDSAVLNRVTGVNPSEIYGTLSSNGKLFLVNPNGIIFGAGSSVNAPAIVASTLDIANEDFLRGSYNFFKNGESAFIINHGRLASQPGGFIALLSQSVNNQGVIIADLGTVVLASGEKMTLALDSLDQISVVIDDAVKAEVLGPDGLKMDSAIKNSGTIQANGGKVILTAKILNNVFDYAVNNSGVIQAGSIQEHDGVIELTVEGAPVVNTGSMTANSINIKVSNADFLNKGSLIANLASGLATGNITINAENILQAGSVTADNEITFTATQNINTDPAVNSDPAVIIQGKRVNLSGRQFGTTTAPLNIKADNIDLSRIQGDISILDSLGIGTSIMLRGPPDGFGAIIYNPDTNLTLEAPQGAINIFSGVILSADNLTLIAKEGITSQGLLLTDHTLSLLSEGPITSLGTLKTDTLIENGASFKVGGIFEVGTAYLENTDHAIIYAADTSVSGAISDAADIVINANISLTLGGDTTFTAGADFIMYGGSFILGGSHNLGITANRVKLLGTIGTSGSPVNNLTITGRPINSSDNNSIQTAINAIGTVSGTSTINVAAGAYNENPIISKSLSLLGPNSGINPNIGSRLAEAVITGQITINHSGVTVNGFTVTNPSGTMGIYVNGVSNISLQNNILTNIGTTFAGSSAVQAVYIYRGSTDISNISIQNSQFTNIGSGNNSSSNKAIFVGDTTSSSVKISNVTIDGNSISGVFAKTTSKGAYGILVNHLAPDIQITNNTIDNLDGLWAHAIGLEGDTPNAVVTGNAISNVVSHNPVVTDGVGVFFETNPSLGTVTVQNNSFATSVNFGVAIHPVLLAAYPGLIVNASGNWWGTNDAAAVAARVSSNVDYTPWLNSGVNSSTGTGFQGDFSVLNVSAASPQAGSIERIQEGINFVNAGGRVNVAAGTYTLGSAIAINKSDLKIWGAQANIDPRPSVGGRTGDETILKSSGTVFDIQANDAEINGFTIESSINNSSLNIVQEVSESFSSKNAKVLYNIIYNTNYPTGAMNEAVKIRTGENARIAYNYIYNIPTPGDGINFDRVTNGTIEYNELKNQGSENAAIYVYGSQNTNIIGNLVYNITQNDGIKLGSKDGSDAAKSGGNIRYNIVHDVAQDGITVYMGNTVVEGNEVYNSTSENGAVYVSFNVNNVSLINNYIHNNGNLSDARTTYGIRIGKSGYYPTNVVIFGNSIENNEAGIYYNNTGASVVLDASGNWWGTTDQATISSLANSGVKVDYTPWLNSGTDTTPLTPGFQGDFSTLNVSAASPQAGATGRIQEGINLVTAAGTVNVTAGTYPEQVTIQKSLSLIGAGEATTIIQAPAVRTGTVTQGATIHDYILAAYAPSSTIDVRVEGFTFDANSQNKIPGTDQLDGVFFRDVKDAGGTLAGLFSSTIHNFAATPDYEGFGIVVYGDSLLTLNNNNISDYTRDGISINRYGGLGSNPNVTISGNTITGSAAPLNGISISGVTSGAVTGNTVTGNTRSAPWAGGGIVLWGSTGVTITGNHVNGNFYGIDLEPGTSGVTISGNELTGNIKRAISLNGANNNTVSSNLITGPGAGTDDIAIALANTSTGNMIGGLTPADGNTITMATSGIGNLYAIHVQGDVGAGSNTIQYNTINGGKRGIQIDGGVTGTTTIVHNTIGSTTAPSFAGIVGAGGTLMITDNTLINAPHPIKLEDADGPGPAAPPTNVSILRNTITGSDFTAIEIACQISGTTKEISNNTISGVSAANFGDGIDIYNPLNWDVPGQNTGFTISGNEISGGTAYFAAMWLDIANSTISGNNIHDNAQGIMLQDGTGNTIENNTITNTRNAGAGAIGGGIILYGTDRNNVHPGTVYGSKNNTIRKNTITGGDIGINVTDLSDANTITENFITGNAIGLQAKTLNVGRDPSGTTLYDNDISGNTTAVNNLSANLIDASANWWGSANATTVAAAAGVSVDYTPWLNSGSDITPLIAGFQGDFSVLNVSAASPQAGATGIIQEGLNLVTSGGTVNVTAGTYNETFTVNKSLELRGAKYGIDARTRDTAGETIIDTPLNGVIYLSANNIIMDGFTIESDTGSGRVEPNGNNLQFLNNITERTVYPRGNPSNMTFRYNLFRDTASTQTIYGTGLYFEPSSASGSRVEDNKFMDLLYSAIILAGDSTPYTNTTISNNEIYRTQFQGINIAGNQSGLTISNNYIEQANLLHGADRGGIRLYGSAFSGTVNITNNTVNNSYNGIAIKDGQNITGKDIHVNYNNLINNSNAGVYNGGIGILDATKNYWGNATGPYNATTNASGSGNAVSDNVDYSPWWGANYIGVAHPWVWYVNQSNGSTIQEGINTATAGDTVNVTAGTYNENINIDKALTLTSPSVLVANNPILQGAGAGTTGITVSSDNVTISHLTIRGYETAIDVAGAYTHLAIENNYFNSNSKYHLRVPVGFDGATVYNIYRNSGNTADDVGVITDDSNRVIEKPAGYRVIWAKLQDAISNNPGGAGNNLDLFHQGDLDLSTTPINTNGGNLNITNKGLLTLGNTNTGSGSINITVNGDPDLLINGTIDSGGGNIDYNVTGYIWQTPTGIILTHGGYYNAIAGNYYKMEALSRIDTTGGAGVGTVTLQADTMDLVGAITTGTNSVTLKQNTNNYPINLGTDGVAGSLCLTNAELNTITAGTLIIGDDNSGSITISNDINPAGAGALSIKAGNNPITFTAHPVTSPNLTLTGSTLTNLDLATLVISGALVVKPSLTNSTIGLAGGAGTFNLDASEIAVLRNSGATSITIGATGGTGALALGADVDLPGKTVTLNSGRINSSTRAIVADTLTLNLSSSTGANTVRTTVTNLAVDTTGGTSANRGITLTDTSDGLILNIINAGAGAVSIDVGNNPIGFTANTITSGNLTLTGSTLTNLDLATLVTPGALVVKPSLTNSTIGLAGGAGDFNLNALEIA
ncbi:MAG: right-handed parallel beta-helix repeat-containing protein, partial [Candidatus Omnitrophota bacterium]